MATSTSLPAPLSILLIEDSKGDALLIEKALKNVIPEGFNLQKAVTLGDALNLLPNYNFDVALLDRSLPDAQEFDGLYSLQNMAPQLPIVFLTAHQNEQTALEAIEHGAQDYLLKDEINGYIVKRAITFAILRKKYEGELILHANFDTLTGLANRKYFESRLDIALAKIKRHDSILAILFLDLDRFKPINDNYGHAAGDAVLKEVGSRLKHSSRPYDTAARFGGDEFALLIEDIPEISHVEIITKKIIALLGKPIQAFGNEFNLGVSIGVVTCVSGQNTLAETLIQQADSAMYNAKAEIGSSYCLWDSDGSKTYKKD